MPKVILAAFGEVRHPRTIGIVSGKGGVGKTNIAANLAVALSMRNKPTVLMDADLGLANADIVLGVRARGHLGELLSGHKTIDDIVVEGPEGVRLIPASSGVAKMASLPQREMGQIISAFAHLKGDVDTLIVDMSAGIAPDVVRFSKAVQHLIVVVCDEPSSITDAYALIKVLNQEHKVDRFHLVTNMCRSESQGQSLYRKVLAATDQYLDLVLNHLGNVPLDGHLKAAVKHRTPVVTAAPHSSSAKAIQRLASRLETLPGSQLPSGDVQFFLQQIVGHGRKYG
ncbi:MAG: flagellar biosynthesis protein FlhG [Candidatus Azotimanducaceae bacterium]|jgi:flagellar biosynthesis protein FlhG